MPASALTTSGVGHVSLCKDTFGCNPPTTSPATMTPPDGGSTVCHSAAKDSGSSDMARGATSFGVAGARNSTTVCMPPE